jgi:hypothetical protein
MTSANENIRQLEGLFREDGAGGLLVCYETGREKPHADSSYQLYPVDPDRKGMTCQFLSLLHVGVETARISAFIPDTRMEVYRFPRMSGLPPFYRDTPVKEYITGMLLPHIKRNRLKPVVSVNLRDMVFIRSEGLSVEPGGILRLLNRTGNAGRIVNLVTDYRTRETKPCYLSKDPVTNEMFFLPADQARCPRKIKDYALSDKEYADYAAGKEIPIEFKSSNGKVYRTSIQMSAAERGTEFLWERSTLKPEKKQGQEQTAGLKETAGKPARRTRQTITPKM